MGLRTLRQIPKATGGVHDGEPVFEIRSVRLVLRGEAAHFNRLVPCSKCGRDVFGPAVLSPDDLDNPAQAVICDRCGATALEPPVRTELVRPTRPSAVAGPPTAEPRLADLERRRDGLTARLAAPDAPPAPPPAGELAALAAGVEQLAQGQQALQGAVARLEQLATAPAPAGDVVTQVNDRLDRLAERAARDAAADVARLEAMEGRIVAIADQLAGAAAADAARLQAMDGRIGQIADPLARAAEAAAAQLRALDERVTDVAGQLARLEDRSEQVTTRVVQSLDAHRTELLGVINEGLTKARSTAAAPAGETVTRFEALERRLTHSAGEMSELAELHAALDVGMGALRSEILDVRGAVNRVASDQADVEDRLEALVRAPAAADQGRGRKGRKGEADAQVGAVLAITEDLGRELQQLKAHVADLQQAADSATAAAARASSQAAASSPFRSEVGRLREQVAAQEEAVAALRRMLDGVRRPPAPKPPRSSTRS